MVLSGYLYLSLAIASSAIMAIVLKLFRHQTGNRYGILLGNYLTCIIIALLQFQSPSIILQTDSVTLICSFISGFLFVAGLVTMQSSIQVNGAILTTAFAKLGLIVPLLMSILFLKERPGVLQILGLFLVFAAIIVINSTADTFSSSTRPVILLLLAVLLACGGGDAMAKIFERAGSRDMDSMYFFLLFFWAFLFALLLMFLELKRTGKRVNGKEFLAGILVGIPNYFSSVLLLKALIHLPAFLVYPCFSTGTILLVSLVSTVIFKEKPGARKWYGLLLILIALILLNL